MDHLTYEKKMKNENHWTPMACMQNWEEYKAGRSTRATTHSAPPSTCPWLCAACPLSLVQGCLSYGT
eukprot:2160975-Heterocapsa_arctica.AAC.1